MKLLVSGEPLPPNVAEKFPQVTYAPCVDDQEIVDVQGWFQPRIFVEACRNRYQLDKSSGHAILDQEGILLRGLSGGWNIDDPRDIERMVHQARVAVQHGKRYFPERKWSHWCSLVNPIYVPNETGVGVRAAAADDMVKLSEQTLPIRQVCEIDEFSLYAYYEELTNGSELNEPWIKSSTRAMLMLSPQRPVMATISNRWPNMKRYSRAFLTNLVKWIKAEYVLRGRRRDYVDILNQWTCDSFLVLIAKGEVPGWWPGHQQQCADEFLSPGALTPEQIKAEDLQTIVEALNA